VGNEEPVTGDTSPERNFRIYIELFVLELQIVAERLTVLVWHEFDCMVDLIDDA
jgi:hypothetical protein